MSDEHRYIEAAMLDAAHNGGFLAVIGESGSGKSVIRKKVMAAIERDGQIIPIFVHTINKKHLTANNISDAILLDLSGSSSYGQEKKSRQIKNLLIEKSKQQYKCVLIIEEAHDLRLDALKLLKRFYEYEDGYKKLLGVILVGQSELATALNEQVHTNIREVTRRIQVAEISGLNGSLYEYLKHKFKRVGADVNEIFTGEAVLAMSERMTIGKDRYGNKISKAYPIIVNNYAVKAMNLAYNMGEAQVTEQVVNAI